MKSLVLFALSVVATAAMAVTTSPSSEIKISGDSIQVVLLSDSDVRNKATGENSLAQQNLASNTGKITIKGKSTQIVAAGDDSVISNKSNANTIAQQNLASNVGDVTIDGKGTSLQIVALLKGSSVMNEAYGRNARAIQNLASNNACFTCGSTDHNDYR